jgi:hypothetical protein
MKAAIIQSNYLPWKGYFDIIHDVDIFVFLEDVQYTSRDWRNRNKIKTHDGIKWISVPILGGINQKIYEAKIDYSQNWIEKHKNMIHHSYARADYYPTYKNEIMEIFNHKFETISDLNIFAINLIGKVLEIPTKFYNSKDLGMLGNKDDKLIAICKKINADIYLSGPAAKDYIQNEKFEREGINLEYKDYHGYPEYTQLWGEDFTHFVSVIDLLFNCGEKSPFYIWGWRDGK